MAKRKKPAKKSTKSKSAAKKSAKKKVAAIPPGYHSVTPYIVCRGAARAIDEFLMGNSSLPAPGLSLGLAK